MYQTTASWETQQLEDEVNNLIHPKVAEMKAAGLTDGIGTMDWPGGQGNLPFNYLRTWTTEEAAQQFKTFLETLPTAPVSVTISQI